MTKILYSWSFNLHFLLSLRIRTWQMANIYCHSYFLLHEFSVHILCTFSFGVFFYLLGHSFCLLYVFFRFYLFYPFVGFFLYILDINPLSVLHNVNIFSSVHGLFFSLIVVLITSFIKSLNIWNGKSPNSLFFNFFLASLPF